MNVERLRIPADADPTLSGRRLGPRVRDLEAAARAAAHEHVAVLRQALAEVAVLSDDIGQGGAAYPVGVRELARRLALQLRGQDDTLSAIMSRQPPQAGV